MIMTVIGTRPEAIKLAPICIATRNNFKLDTKICITMQHSKLLKPFLKEFELEPSFCFKKLNNVKKLSGIASRILEQFGEVLSSLKPDFVLVQGDTTTTFIATLAAFYEKIPIIHVEAGLRTGDLFSPWPEEANRVMTDKLSNFFFAPTKRAVNNLLMEGIPKERIWLVGNTSIDAVRLALEKNPISMSKRNKKIIVTAHRRENYDQGISNLCKALIQLSASYPYLEIIFVLHGNPVVYLPVRKAIGNIKNITLMNPMNYASFIRLISGSIFIISDSGGLQEEAAFIGKPVLVIRDNTERQESVEAGCAKCIGNSVASIIYHAKELLDNIELLKDMSKKHFFYGDGYASEKIVNIIENTILPIYDN